ncbi:MAG: signal peptidase II [Caulobacteraceae bacterium]|nr:signal peptidase II [Caulobacter sp.]
MWPLLAYVVAAVAVGLDQLSKWWVLGPLDLRFRGQVPVVPPLFNFTLVHNTGVSFGLLRASADLGRWLLTLFSLAVAVALAVWVRRAARPLTALSIGLIIGGAVGNAIDRIRLGFVVDFIDVSGLHFPWVFNVADSCITVGVALLVLESLFQPAAKKP